MAQLVEHLLSSQVMIPESWDQVLHWAPCSAGSLPLPLLLPPSAPTLSQINKILKKKKKNIAFYKDLDFCFDPHSTTT